MAKKEEDVRLLAIRTMFLNNNIRKMKDLEKLYPTLVSKSLGINHSRYIEKLHAPEDFTVQNLLSLAALFKINVQLIWSVVVRQTKR
jgi:hypothetical protein